MIPLDEKIDDLIDHWHEGYHPVFLWEFLGMSEKQYGRWLRDSDDLDVDVVASIHARWVEEFGPPVTEHCCHGEDAG
jgi:hypothetical protein